MFYFDEIHIGQRYKVVVDGKEDSVCVEILEPFAQDGDLCENGKIRKGTIIPHFGEVGDVYTAVYGFYIDEYNYSTAKVIAEVKIMEDEND